MPSAILADVVTIGHVPDSHDTLTGVVPETPHALLLAAWKPNFPSPELLREAAALLPLIHHATDENGLLAEGPRSYIRIGPGVVELRTKDFARAQRTAERELLGREKSLEQLALYLEREGRFPDDPEPTRVITDWSRKSRSNMIRTIGLLDFTEMYADRTRLPCMVTLTYPGCWLRVAPNGKAVKAHLKALRKRYERAYGEPMRCLWKQEFQGRVHEGTTIPKVCTCEHCDGLDDGRAPHVHMLLLQPRVLVDGMDFRRWLSLNWADVVDHPDGVQRANHLHAGTGVDESKGMDTNDPKRISVYFAKHGVYSAKEYQHLVPQAWQQPGEGPGRFWGYWGVEKTKVMGALPEDVRIELGRTMRRWSRAQGTTRRLKRERRAGGRLFPRYAEVQGLAGAMLVQAYEDTPVKRRYSRGRAVRMAENRGFVMVNSGPEFVSQLSRHLDQAAEPLRPWSRYRLEPGMPLELIRSEGQVISVDQYISTE